MVEGIRIGLSVYGKTRVGLVVVQCPWFYVLFFNSVFSYLMKTFL